MSGDTPHFLSNMTVEQNLELGNVAGVVYAIMNYKELKEDHCKGCPNREECDHCSD